MEVPGKKKEKGKKTRGQTCWLGEPPFKKKNKQWVKLRTPPK
jgi:hypothetical protein